jgi:hypothetical protein
MEIRPPTWSLRNERCPCCEGQGELCFSACPACGRLVLVCAEIGTVFADLRAASRRPHGNFDDKSCVCPGCRRVPIALFREALDEEIQAAGFTPADYV